MRIALVSPYDFATRGGVNEHIAHLSREFSRRGHDAVIIAPQSAPAVRQDSASFHGFGRVVPIPANGSVARVSFALDQPQRIKRLMEQGRFDIVHCHEPFTPALPLFALRYSRSVNIGTFHAYREGNPVLCVARPLLRPFFDRLDGLVAVSEPARAYVSRYFTGEFRVVPNGVDVSVFERPAAPVPHLMDGRSNLLFLGRFEEGRKGFSCALSAVARTKVVYPDIRLVVVGAGNPAKYRRQIDQYGIASNVHFAGTVSDEERASYMASCQLLLAPSTHGESQGVVLLEAMAAGLPVIAGDIPGYASVMTHGREGLLIPPREELLLVDAMVRLLSNAPLRAHMGRRGRQKAGEHRWPEVVSRLLDVYAEARQRKG